MISLQLIHKFTTEFINQAQPLYRKTKQITATGQENTETQHTRNLDRYTANSDPLHKLQLFVVVVDSSSNAQFVFHSITIRSNFYHCLILSLHDLYN